MSALWQVLGDDWLVEDPQAALGWRAYCDDQHQSDLINYLEMQIAVAELASPEMLSRLNANSGATSSALWRTNFLSTLQEKNRLLSEHRAPIDERIERFLTNYLGDAPIEKIPTLPTALTLDRHGMARILSLPADGDRFENELLTSYRVHNGVVHNPRNDRRTTKGTFHVCEGGLPIPADKVAVPKSAFARLLQIALKPPADLMTIPYLANINPAAKAFVSLMLRPLVSPTVPGFGRYKSMEVRFFVPAGLVSNLDFVESIFGNAGDPLIPEHDAALDVLHWSGHTGCVILAPHLTQVTKHELGLPHWDDATERQRRDGMCYRDQSEKYNDGSAFKLTCRNSEGVIVTLIADNYYGYCKKEVKTQISYAANLMGNAEEEHAGGTLAFPSYSLGDEFQVNSQRYNGRTFADVARDYADFVEVQPNGYGIDKYCDKLVYIPENARASLYDQLIRWHNGQQECCIALEPNKVYMAPSGYKIRMEKHPAAPSWRLVGTSGEGIVCHKPCTVSGGGKSEISKSLRDYMLSGPIFVNDLNGDFDKLDELFKRDYSNRWRPELKEQRYANRQSRSILDPNRSLGSVIKLLTPSHEYTDDYNAWLRTIPGSIYAMAFIIKRFLKPEWEGRWREHFSVDIVNGEPGHQLKYNNRPLVGMYLRVGLDNNRRWQTYKLRQDFAASAKIQLEDDITVSVVVPAESLDEQVSADRSHKFVANCEYRLFQRPDDAIHPGLDKQTELDVSQPDNFFCNFEPLDKQQLRGIVADVMTFENFSEPLSDMLQQSLQSDSQFVVSSAHPRIVNGEPTKNPRYLQDRPDLSRSDERYIAMRGVRLFRRLPVDAPVYIPVNAVLSGRRNNPPDKAAGIRSLAVYNPIHYQELPELFMDYVCSLTGKSPSTTGAGSEGALTKGPFNALLPIHDLNAALVSSILTRVGGYSTAAGYIGNYVDVGHDVSLLVPELWCRLSPEERDPDFLIRERMLDKLSDFEWHGQTILASRLGYRINARFVNRFFGRMFDNPDKVFNDEVLCPEKQDHDSYADGINHIIEAQQRVALQYFEDGSFEFACPPLKAVLAVMAYGNWDGKSICDPEVRELFSREAMLDSNWYRDRLDTKRKCDIALWQRHLRYLTKFSSQKTHQDVVERMKLPNRIQQARERIEFFKTEDYVRRLQGTLGTDPALMADFKLPQQSTPAKQVVS